MIHPVENSSAKENSTSNGGVSASGGGSFASILDAAKKKPAAHGTIEGDLKTDLVPPKGETWAPVPGHTDYADILSGPRDGFYVALEGPRKGKAFVIAHSHGNTYHVYGEGDHKQWIRVGTKATHLKPPKGESWVPVPGHSDYKKIVGGKRHGEYVNLSGNSRTGKVFRIERHDGKIWHVYGSGKHRHEVPVGRY